MKKTYFSLKTQQWIRKIKKKNYSCMKYDIYVIIPREEKKMDRKMKRKPKTRIRSSFRLKSQRARFLNFKRKLFCSDALYGFWNYQRMLQQRTVKDGNFQGNWVNTRETQTKIESWLIYFNPGANLSTNYSHRTSNDLLNCSNRVNWITEKLMKLHEKWLKLC